MILIIANKRRTARSLENILRLSGLITKACVPMDAPKHTDSSLSAIVVMYPEALIDAQGYLRLLSEFNLMTPIFAVTESPEALPEGDFFADIIRTDEVGKRLLDTIHRAQAARLCRKSGEYRLFPIDASVFRDTVTVLDKEIRFTKKEKAILRYLICIYPRGADAHEIISVVYPDGCVPQPSCVRAHICGINKKAMPTLHRPLIVARRGEGYILEPSGADKPCEN